MIERGLYRLNFRGLTWSDCWRLGRNPPGVVLAALWKLRAKPGPYMWLPTSEAERICTAGELSAACRATLEPLAVWLRGFGYCRGLYKTQGIRLVENIEDDGGYLALHDDGQRACMVAYIHSVVVSGERRIEKRTVTATGGFLLASGTSVDVMNAAVYMTSRTRDRRIVLPGADIGMVVERIRRELERCHERVRQFVDLDSFVAAVYELDDEVFAERVGYGLLERVPPTEVAEVMARAHSARSFSGAHDDLPRDNTSA